MAAGYSANGLTPYDSATVRYDSDGALDTTFNASGIALTDIGNQHNFSNGVMVQSDGRIVVVGHAFTGTDGDFSVIRYNTDGSLDTSFHGTGKVTTPIGGGDEIAYSVAEQSDGKIVVAGYSRNGSNNDFALVRYEGSPVPLLNGQVVVDARAAIFGAGFAGNAGGLPPVAIVLPAGTGRRFVITDTEGSIYPAFPPPGTVFFGADGGNFGNHPGDVGSLGGISGIIDDADHKQALLAVVTSGSVASGTAAPARLDFRGAHDFATLSPEERQTFFAGDGKAAGGTIQEFLIPDGATTLYLGFADNGGSAGGPPGQYGDNQGAITVAFQILPPGAVPDEGHIVKTPPIAVDDLVTMSGVTVTFDPRSNDNAVVPGSLTITAVTQGGAGTVTTDGTSVTYTAGAGFSQTDTFTYTITNAEGASATATVSVTTNPVTTLLYLKGTAVPGAGGAYIPNGATWFSFGIPAVDENGKVGYVGKWKNPTGSGLGTYGSGLFVNSSLRVAAGSAVPGAGNDGLPADAKFKAFKDPVISADHLAAIAQISGTGVGPANDNVVIRVRPTGEVTVLAREGGEAEGAGGATIKAFKGVSIAGGTVALGATGTLYTAALTLNSGTPATTGATDFGAWLYRDGTTHLVAREGVTAADGFGVGEKVKTFKVLGSVSGSPGQGRGQTGPQLASFTEKSSLGIANLLRYTIAGGLEAVVSAGDTFGTSIPGAKWKSFGPLSHTDRVALAGALSGVPGAESKGIFVGDVHLGNWERVIYATAGTGVSGITFKAFKDPVLAATGGGLAFGATLGGSVTPTTDTSIWWRPGGSAALELLAQEGMQADEAPAGAFWKSFTSLALPGGTRGPLLLATLIPGGGNVTTDNDLGLWGVDSSGDLRLLVRENVTMIDGKTVKAFAVLKAVSGTPGVTRSFNSAGAVVLRVIFIDNTSAIVKITVP